MAPVLANQPGEGGGWEGCFTHLVLQTCWFKLKTLSANQVFIFLMTGLPTKLTLINVQNLFLATQNIVPYFFPFGFLFIQFIRISIITPPELFVSCTPLMPVRKKFKWELFERLIISWWFSQGTGGRFGQSGFAEEGRFGQSGTLLLLSTYLYCFEFF